MTTCVVILGVRFSGVYLPGAQSDKQKNFHWLKTCSSRAKLKLAVSMLQGHLYQHQQGAMTLEKAKELGSPPAGASGMGLTVISGPTQRKGVNVVLYGQKDVRGRIG